MLSLPVALILFVSRPLSKMVGMDKMTKSSPIFSTVENNTEVSMTTSPISPEDFAAFGSDDNILGEIAKMKQEELDKKFPRVRLAHLPTPLEFCPRLTEALGGVEIYVKRDDCTGLATGGNKARKLGKNLVLIIECFSCLSSVCVHEHISNHWCVIGVKLLNNVKQNGSWQKQLSKMQSMS